jgi:hypothetical protein
MLGTAPRFASLAYSGFASKDIRLEAVSSFSQALLLLSVLAFSLGALFVTTAAADPCSSVRSGAKVDPEANLDQSQPPERCSVRGLTESECDDVPGHKHFKKDHGSGFTECFFDPPTSSSESDSSTQGANSPVGSVATCKAGYKDCEGTCIPYHASCCANGRGVYCEATTGGCCFNPNQSGAQQGYTCCAADSQCVYETGPTQGQCVSSMEGEPSPSRSEAPRSRKRIEASPNPNQAAENNKCTEQLITVEETVHDTLEANTLSEADVDKVNELLDQADALCTDGKFAEATATLATVNKMVGK